MDNKKIQSILQDALEEKIPSSQIELWPAVKASLVAGKHPLIQQGEKMNTIKPRRISRAALIALMIVVLLALAFITPQGRAFAQSILQFFIRSESDAIPVPTEEPVTWVDLTPGLPPATSTPLPAIASFADDCGDFPNPICSVEHIRGRVNFTVKELGIIPEGLYFIGATGGPDSISLSYEFENHAGGIHIFEERWTGVAIQVGASAAVEKVQIGGLTGEYVRGTFIMYPGDPVATWDMNAGNEILRWVDDGTSYTMFANLPDTLEKEGMAALAESMTTESVAKLPMPVSEPVDVWNPKDTYNLSISEAEELAGFKLLLPTRLPEILSLVGASHDAEHNIIEVYYSLDQNLYGPTTEGILLRQQIAPDLDDCFLCDILIGDYNEFAEDAGNANYFKEIVPSAEDIETVQIGALTGQYVQGVWSGTDCCGWVWDPIPYRKNLRWWSNGMAFELSYFGMHIEKADMIKIAESLK